MKRRNERQDEMLNSVIQRTRDMCLILRRSKAGFLLSMFWLFCFAVAVAFAAGIPRRFQHRRKPDVPDVSRSCWCSYCYSYCRCLMRHSPLGKASYANPPAKEERKQGKKRSEAKRRRNILIRPPKNPKSIPISSPESIRKFDLLSPSLLLFPVITSTGSS